MKKRQLITAAAGTALAAAALSKSALAAAMGPVLAVISHPVKDYAAWRAVYDGAEPIRRKAGVTGAEVFRDPKEANLIVVIYRFASLEAAQAFLGDQALKDAMMKAGVTAPPAVTIAVAA